MDANTNNINWTIKHTNEFQTPMCNYWILKIKCGHSSSNLTITSHVISIYEEISAAWYNQNQMLKEKKWSKIQNIHNQLPQLLATSKMSLGDLPLKFLTLFSSLASYVSPTT